MTAVGFIGTGHIAAPMARTLARDGHGVTVSRRSEAVSSGLASAGLGIEVTDNQDVIDASKVVFLCLRPAVWREVLEGLKWRTDQRIVSVMAGVAMGDIAEACTPVADISVTIPYGFIENGGCPLPVAGNPMTIEALFGSRNPVLPQADEKALIYHFAASALASGVLGLLEESADWLASKTGNSDGAEIYVTNLIAGVLGDMDKSRAGRLAEEKAALATPNTLNLQMVEGLEEAGSLKALPVILDRIAQSMEPET